MLLTSVHNGVPLSSWVQEGEIPMCTMMWAGAHLLSSTDQGRFSYVKCERLSREYTNRMWTYMVRKIVDFGLADRGTVSRMLLDPRLINTSTADLYGDDLRSRGRSLAALSGAVVKAARLLLKTSYEQRFGSTRLKSHAASGPVPKYFYPLMQICMYARIELTVFHFVKSIRLRGDEWPRVG